MRVGPRGRQTLLRLLQERGVRVTSDCGGVGTCGKCRVTIKDSTGTRRVFACRYVPTEAVKVSGVRPAVTNIRTRDSRREYAAVSRKLVVDVGTTTVAFAVVESGKIVARQDVLNPQLSFGADVMSRIAAGAGAMKAGLHELIAGFAEGHGVSRRQELVAVGNTVMAHFLAGKSPSSLGEYPYRSRLPLKRVLRFVAGGLRLRILPLLGSFVGSDCTAAILASGIWRSRRLGLLIDAGTNGEVVIGNCERLLLCSTAAGPAFEGATLECGSLARRGAIKGVAIQRGQLVPDVVGQSEPGSICGSGVVDAVACGLRLGLIDRSGRVRAGQLELSRHVFVSQDDLRAVQLAKGAIVAAVRLLLQEWGARLADIYRLHVTGKFGAALNLRSAMAIGLLPTLSLDKVRQHGNLALRGAVQAALSPYRLQLCERLAEQCSESLLAEDPGFETAFVDGMSLEPWTE